MFTKEVPCHETVSREAVVLSPIEPVSQWQALNESQQLLACELADTQERVSQMLAMLEQTVLVLTESMDRAQQRELSLRREIDRLVWIVLSVAGVLLGSMLWLFLKP